MSLSQRLRQLQIPNNAEVANLDHLTLAELSTETVSFGQKHVGSSYEETWKDQEWVHFMINRYQKSQKESHRRYLKYVELKIESLESNQDVMPVRHSAGESSRHLAKAKPVAKRSATPTVISSLDGEADWDFEPEMYDPPTMGASNRLLEENMGALQQRMLNMEDALTRVIRYIENPPIQTQGNIVSEHE